MNMVDSKIVMQARLDADSSIGLNPYLDVLQEIQAEKNKKSERNDFGAITGWPECAKELFSKRLEQKTIEIVAMLEEERKGLENKV